MTRKPRKRANGEGTVYELPNGLYKATVTVDHKPDGTPIRKSANAKTKKDALARAREKAVQYHARGPVTSSSETVGRYLHRWLESGRVKGKVRPATLKSYSHAVSMIEPHIGHLRLCDLKPDHIQHAYDTLGKDYAPATLATVRAILHHAFEQAIEWELMERNPVKYADPPKVEKVARNVLSTAQARALFQRTENSQYRTLFMVLASCGLRISEALALTWDDLDDGFLKVRKGKTKAAARSVPVTPDVIHALEWRRSEQRIEKVANRDIWNESSLIFTTKTGNPIDSRYAWEVFKRSLKACAYPDMRLHDLRRTAVLWMREAGIDMDVVQAILGHEHMSTTQQIYGTVNRDRLEDAREKLTDYLRDSVS